MKRIECSDMGEFEPEPYILIRIDFFENVFKGDRARRLGEIENSARAPRLRSQTAGPTEDGATDAALKSACCFAESVDDAMHLSVCTLV